MGLDCLCSTRGSMCCRLHCSVVLAAQKTLVPSLASQRWNSSLLSESPRVIAPFLQQHRLLGRTAAVLSFNLCAGTGPYRSWCFGNRFFFENLLAKIELIVNNSSNGPLVFCKRSLLLPRFHSTHLDEICKPQLSRKAEACWGNFASLGCKVICGYFQSLGRKRCAALFGTESLARMIGAVEKGRMTAPRIGFAFCIQIVRCWFHLWISCDRVSTFAAFGLHWSAVGSVTKPRFRRWMLRLFWRSSRQSKAFLTATWPTCAGIYPPVI